jgi:trk system potassium uptake protein TrkH
VVALAVAMIPLLGAGGFRLIKAEATGPDKAKFTASIATTAKILWFIYFGFTALVAVLLWYVGLDPIDALCHAFSTFATGGFSSRNLSIGSFGIPAAEWICTVFMLLASVNFMLFCRLFTGRVSDFFRNSELRVFTAIVFISVAVIAIVQTLSGDGNFSDVVRDAAFQVAAVITSTGFTTNDYTTWAPASQIIIIMLLCVGGCSGSTAGGVKVVRWMIKVPQRVAGWPRKIKRRLKL